MRVKVYVVQRADGEVLAAKLTRAHAQAVAKQHAPARVIFLVADKTTSLDPPPDGVTARGDPLVAGQATRPDHASSRGGSHGLDRDQHR